MPLRKAGGAKQTRHLSLQVLDLQTGLALGRDDPGVAQIPAPLPPSRLRGESCGRPAPYCSMISTNGGCAIWRITYTGVRAEFTVFTTWMKV